MWGWGLGQREFIGFGAAIKCSHCNNNVVEHVMVKYSYEILFFVKERYYGGRGSKIGDEGEIIFMCPICNFGFRGATGIESAERSQKSISKGPGGAKAAAQAMIDAQNELSSASNRFNVQVTKDWVLKMNPIERFSYLRLLKRLGMSELSGRLT